MPVPRVFLIRHGQTEWTNTGQFTGRTDIPLTKEGEAEVITSGNAVVGPGKMIDPSKLSRIFISPRTRALRTYELMFDAKTRAILQNECEITEDIREWDYGAYEGKLTKHVRTDRKDRGLDVDRLWNIWLDGCEDGESPSQMSARIDNLITKIKKIQGPYMNGERWVDIVIIAHGHSLRAFAKRWIGFELAKNLPLMLEPGAIGVLSYEHSNVDEPALLLGVNMGTREGVV